MTAAAVTRFALRQGGLRGLLEPPLAVDEAAPTTSALPPAQARGDRGVLLPLDASALLDGTPFPHGRIGAAVGPDEDRLGYLLLAAFGLQRREPANPANDHRTTASVRSKFPVHVFVLGPHGPLRYLDVYRHALVDVGIEAGTDAHDVLRPGGGGMRVLLAGRHTDLPAFYGVLRSALADLEVGVQLRALITATDVLGLRAEVVTAGAVIDTAAALVRRTGPGSWSDPVVVTVSNVPNAPSVALEPMTRDVDDIAGVPAGDLTLEACDTDPGLSEIAGLTSLRLGCAASEPAEAHSIPEHGGVGVEEISWARVQWNRTAGRVPARHTGFSAMPAQRDDACLRALLDWTAVPGPDRQLRAVAADVDVHVVIQGWHAHRDGHHQLIAGELIPVRIEDGVGARLEDAFGYPLTATNDCGVRHALATFLLCVDPARVVADHGPAAWSLLQLWCGWVAHGLSTAAAAHGLFARPARSFDEYQVAHQLGLPPRQTPVFTTVCGQTRYAEPMLDLRPW